MAKLSDYGIQVDKLSNVSTVRIDGKDFPIILSHEAIEFIGDVYKNDYAKFQDDLNDFLQRSEGAISVLNMRSSDWKIVKALVYGMLRAGGLEEPPTTIFAWLGMRPATVEVFGKCMEVFSKNGFQVEDVKKSTKPQDFQKASPQKKQQKKRNLKR